MDADQALEAAAQEYAVLQHVRHSRREGRGGDRASTLLQALRVRDFLKSECGVRNGTLLAASLLLEIPQRTQGSLPDVEARFGSAVRNLVEQVAALGIQGRAERRPTESAALTTAPTDVVLLALAHRLDDVRHLTGLSLDRAFALLGDTMVLVAEGRGRLGERAELDDALARAVHALRTETDMRMRAAEAALAAGRTDEVAPKRRRRRSGRGGTRRGERSGGARRERKRPE